MSLRKFAFVAEGDVFTTWQFDPEDKSYGPNAEMIIAGLLSNPTIVECTDTLEVGIGYTWDGKEFKEPSV